jgi:hypothetical protein
MMMHLPPAQKHTAVAVAAAAATATVAACICVQLAGHSLQLCVQLSLPADQPCLVCCCIGGGSASTQDTEKQVMCRKN